MPLQLPSPPSSTETIPGGRPHGLHPQASVPTGFWPGLTTEDPRRRLRVEREARAFIPPCFLSSWLTVSLWAQLPAEDSPLHTDLSGSVSFSLSLSCDSSLPFPLRPRGSFKISKCTSPRAQHFPCSLRTFQNICEQSFYGTPLLPPSWHVSSAPCWGPGGPHPLPPGRPWNICGSATL